MVELCLGLGVRLVENIGKMASSTVLAVKMGSHEDPGTAVFVGTLTPQASDFSVLVNLSGKRINFFPVLTAFCFCFDCPCRTRGVGDLTL